MRIDRKVFLFIFLFLVMSTIISTISTTAYSPSYYKPIYINNTGGSEQTYYQVLLNVSYDSDMQTDFDDLRVKYYNGVEWVFIPYWVEDKVDSEWCKLWFNATSIPANSWCNDTYRLYYGDNTVNNVSNGETTFEFFDDDFSDLTLKWNDIGGSTTVEDGYVKLENSGSKKWFWSKRDFSYNRALRTKLKTIGDWNHYFGWQDGNSEQNQLWFMTTGGKTRTKKAGSKEEKSWSGRTTSEQIYEIHRIGTGQVDFYQNGVLQNSHTNTDYIPTIDLSVGVHIYWSSGCGGDEIWIDWILVRRYSDPEPTSQLGEEQSTGGCTAPSISDLTNSTPGATSVTITWTTNQSADNRVKYSKNSDLSDCSWSSWDNDTTSVSITLTGLEPNTTYWYQAWSYNNTNSNCYTTEPDSSPYQNFTTLNLSGIEPLYINIEETGEGYVKINASWIGFNAFETGHYFVFCGISYGKVKSKEADGDGKLTVEETLYGLFVEGEEYCCKAAVYRENSSTDSVYTDEACFVATSNKILKQTSYGNYMDNLIDISSESNVTTWASALSEPYKDRMGMTFFGIIFILPFIAMWIRGSNTIIPSILGLILGGFIWAYMPEKFVHMAYLFIIISIAGVIYGIFRQKV